MKSSTDKNREYEQDKRVLLPSFMDMMRSMGGTGVFDDEGVENEALTVAKTEYGKLRAQLDQEVRDTEALCANMRREALAEIDRLLEQARQEAISIREKARRDITEELKSSAREENESFRASLKKAATALAEERAALFDALEPELLEFSMHVCESILHYELMRDDDAYLSIIRNALFILHSDGKSRKLHLPPKAYARLVGDEEQSPFAINMQELGIAILRDAAVQEGDCLVESSLGGVRAGVSTQMSRIRYVLSKQDE